MKRLRVCFRKSASNDLAEIGFYLEAGDSARPVALAYLDGLRASCSRIGDAPEGGRLRYDLAPGLRMWSFERGAVIMYQIDDLGVRIVIVFHGGRDVDAFYARRAGNRAGP